MSDLDCHVEDYLRLRRALGFKLRREGEILPQLVRYLEAAGASRITTELAIAWARLPEGVQPIQWAHRLGVARGFARYLSTLDPATEVPPADVFPRAGQRRSPYVYSDAEVRCLLEAAGNLRPPLRAATYVALFGLLWATGMRVGEALSLRRDDFDLQSGVLTVTEAKFGRSRLVPLHASTTAALCSYVECRDGHYPGTEAFFVSRLGTPLAYSTVKEAFGKLTTATGLRSGSRRPRIHDLRHSFAIRVLVESYRSEADVQARMGVLSRYLGHVEPKHTYWYLSATPELMELAAVRLEHGFGGRP